MDKKLLNEDAFKSTFEKYQNLNYWETDKDNLHKLVQLYESGITGLKDSYGNDKAITIAIKKHPNYEKEGDVAKRSLYNFIVTYTECAHRTNNPLTSTDEQQNSLIIKKGDL